MVAKYKKKKYGKIWTFLVVDILFDFLSRPKSGLFIEKVDPYNIFFCYQIY